MGWWRPGKRVDCHPSAHPVAMATKPNQNVTGAASSGRQPGRIITRSTTLSTRLYLQQCWSTPSYCRAFSYTKEKRKRWGGGGSMTWTRLRPWETHSTAIDSTVTATKADTISCFKMENAWSPAPLNKQSKNTREEVPIFTKNLHIILH
jgi:hypothetical protein